MYGDVTALASELSPYITAAIGAYGVAVLNRAQEDAADATVSWGRRLLQRVFGVAETEDQVPEAIADLAADPNSSDLQAALRVHIVKKLQADSSLESAIRTMMQSLYADIPKNSATQINAAAYGNAQQAVQGSGIQQNKFRSSDE